MKIIIFTASTGGGHKRAAAAIEAKIKAVSPDTKVKVIDAMKTIGRVYDKTVCDGYHFMATKIPKVYGKFYKITDRRTLMYKAVMQSNTMMSAKLLDTINEYKPDAIIMCHPFVTTMISKLRRQHKIDVKAISLITDYDAHRTYIVPYVDAYVLAEPDMATKLIDEYGVDKSIIYPLGIPIFDRFTEAFDKKAICEREGLDPNKPTILLMAGSFGVTSVLSFYKALAERAPEMQFIVITGRNIKLFANLEKVIEETGMQDNTKLLYFVKNVEDYMHISDLIVTKPGGLTVTESLACSLPMAIYSAFPGQERDNAEFLLNKGAAIMLRKKTGADDIVNLVKDKEKLDEMKEKCRELHRPDSAEKYSDWRKSFVTIPKGEMTNDEKALSVALCLLMAGTVLTACSNPDEFSDSENLSLKYTRSDKTDDTFNYADGAKTAPSSYDTYSAKITDFELRLFRNRHKSGSYVFCPANAVLNLEAMANGASGDTQEEITNALCSGVTLENMNQCASYFASRIQSVASSDKSPESSQSSEKDSEKNSDKSFVKLCNSLISNDNADIMTGFLQTTKDYYDTNVLRFKFSDSDALKKLDKNMPILQTTVLFLKILTQSRV